MRTFRKKSAPPIIRMGHILAFTAYLRHNGGSVDKHFRHQKLPTDTEDPDVFVPLRQAWAFFDATAQDFDPMLGWQVGQFVGDQNLNRAFLSKIKHAPTLYQALKKFIRMSSAEASHLHLGIRERRNDIVLFTHYPDMRGVQGYTSSQSYQLGVILSVIQHYTGKSWFPKEVGIQYPFVPAAAEALFPGSRILPCQRIGYMTIPRHCLHLPRSGSDSEESSQDKPLVLTKKFDYIETLCVLLRPHIAEGYPSASLAATLMNTSVRTLARRLTDFDINYHAIVDRIRFNEAKRLLKRTDIKIIDVSAAVGFEDASNFARMFRRVGGLSPHEFRKVQRQQLSG